MIQRFVTKIGPLDPENLENGGPSPFSRFLDLPNLILLGDPGSGKSHTFKAAAAHEEGVFFTAREFIAYEGEGCDGRVLYIDALDEFRSRTAEANSISQIVSLVRKSKPSKFRLSCRIHDWLGETDLSLFRRYFRDSGKHAVLRLEPLTDEEIKIILNDLNVNNAIKFLSEAKAKGLDDLFRNPQTLLMLIDILRDGDWPATKYDLYDQATSLLLAEPNKTLQTSALGTYGSGELTGPIGAAFACLLISGMAGLSLSGDSSESDYPTYREVPVDDVLKVQSALARRAFTGAGGENVTYVHRTIAEFLAAKWIADRVQCGFPIARVQSLIGIGGHARETPLLLLRLADHFYRGPRSDLQSR
jgi:hypothetical protein